MVGKKCQLAILSSVIYGILFIITLLTMIFSINFNSINSPVFQMSENLINYDKLIYKYFITDVKFGDFLVYNNYGLTGDYGTKCYVGACYTRREHTSLNCSEACSISKSPCYVGEQECSIVYCELCSKYSYNAVCNVYNEIVYWKGLKMKLTKVSYYFAQLNDTVLYNESCREGFKQCGYINKNKDKLCLTDNEDCPINKVVVKDENITPTDFNYSVSQMGDKYFFYTNENIDNYLYQTLIADTEINPTNFTEVIDTQPIKDFINENPYIYDGNYTSKSIEELNKYGDAKLKIAEEINQTSLEELRKLQEIYLKKINLYTKEKLSEMNDNVDRYKSLLLGFNITSFVYTFVAGIVFIVISVCNFKDMNPLKRAFIFLLLFLILIFFKIYSFILVIINKITFNEYNNMDFINEYNYCGKSKDNCLDENIYYNNSIFICHIIGFVLIISSTIAVNFSDGFKSSDNNDDKKQKLNQSSDFQNNSGLEMKTTNIGKGNINSMTSNTQL